MSFQLIMHRFSLASSSSMHVQVSKDCKIWVQVSQPCRPTDAVQPLKWVLLMHGFPDTADMWRDQVSALTAAGYAVVAPDMPGFGRSAFKDPADVKQYRLRNIVSLMVGLLDQLGISKAAVVGHDWGAAVAWVFAQRAPQRCSHLVVLSVGHPGAGAAVDPRQRAHWWYQLFFCLPGAEAAVVANDWALFRQIMGCSCSTSQVQEAIHRLRQPGALTSALNWYRANTHPLNFAATAPQPPSSTPLIAVPVLGVWSTADSALLEPQMVASKAYVAAGCRQYVRLEGVGHWIPRDTAQQLNELLLGFLGGGGEGEGGGVEARPGYGARASSSRDISSGQDRGGGRGGVPAAAPVGAGVGGPQQTVTVSGFRSRSRL